MSGGVHFASDDVLCDVPDVERPSPSVEVIETEVRWHTRPQDQDQDQHPNGRDQRPQSHLVVRCRGCLRNASGIINH